MIGRHGRAFIMDRDPKAAVWNRKFFQYSNYLSFHYSYLTSCYPF